MTKRHRQRLQRRTISQRRHDQRGMTLLEVLIVMALIAIVMGVAIPSFNSLTHLNLRKSSTQLAGTMRYLYNQAALKGLCMRLVINLKNNSYQVEASTDGQCLVESNQYSAKDAKRKRKEKKRKEKEAAKKQAETTASGGWNGEPPVSLEQKKFTFSAYNDDLVKSRSLPNGISFHGVFTSRQKEIYTAKEGPEKVYIHCFPLGLCERSIIFLQDKSGEIFSLEVKPLTGRVSIFPEKIKLQDYHKDTSKGVDSDVET